MGTVRQLATEIEEGLRAAHPTSNSHFEILVGFLAYKIAKVG